MHVSKKHFPVLAANAGVCLGLVNKSAAKAEYVHFAEPDGHGSIHFANSDFHQISSQSFLRLSNPSSNVSFSSPKCCTKRALRKFAAVPPLKPPKLLAAVLPSTSSWITRFTCHLSSVAFQALSIRQYSTQCYKV